MVKKAVQKRVAILLAIIILAAQGLPMVHAQAASFTDVPNSHSQYVAISYLADLGVIKGYDDGHFRPNGAITRAAALKMLLEASEIEPVASVTEPPFADVPTDAWFAPYVAKAKEGKVVSGNEDGTFSPQRQVNRSEFIKMLAEANQLNIGRYQNVESTYTDVPEDAWFKSYMIYAARTGLISQDAEGRLMPDGLLDRGEAADILYLFSLTKKGDDTQFLLRRAEVEMAQIEIYMTAQKPDLAKKASRLAVDLTQQAYQNLSDHPVVVGAAKLARAYDLLVDAYLSLIQGQKEQASDQANQAIAKATEAWEANNTTQPIARHIKDVARDILKRAGGTEQTVQ